MPPRSARSLNPDLDAAIGGLIRARRRQLNMSQTALAEAIGVTFQQVQKYEKGWNRISVSTLVHLAKALQAPPSFFLAEAGIDSGPKDEVVDAVRRDYKARALVKCFMGCSDAQRAAVLNLTRALEKAPV